MQQLQQGRQKGFDKFDADEDGSLSFEEFTSIGKNGGPQHAGGSGAVQSPEELFATIDADGSGDLSQGEMQAHHQSTMGGMMGGSGQSRNQLDSGTLSQLLQFQETESAALDDMLATLLEEDTQTA